MPKNIDGIIDQIDLLVDEQLAKYEDRSGYDHNVGQDNCHHCNRPYHGLRVTERIEQMRIMGTYDESYRYAEDKSETLCEGSTFIGPMKHPPVPNMNTLHQWITQLWDMSWNSLTSSYGTSWQLLAETRRWWCLSSTSARWYHSLEGRIVIDFGTTLLAVDDDSFQIRPDPCRIYVLQQYAPTVGGTWEPVTAPGVTQLPTEALQ